MPPETFNWDRKEFVRDRNHDRSSEPRHYSHTQPHLHPHPHQQISRGGGGGGGRGYGGVGRISGGGPRWREHNFFPNSHHPYPQINDHHPSPRWASDARCRQGPSGYGKHGGRHFHEEEEGRGFVSSSRPRDKFLVDETFRVSASRKFIRYNRENKSFGQKEWKGHYTDAAPLPHGPGTPNGMNDKPKSMDDVLTSNASYSCADLAELHDQSQLKKQHEENDTVKTTVGDSQKCEGEASIGGAVDWKCIKGSRSVIFSSCGSGISFTKSSKDMEMDSINSKECVQSPSCGVDNPIEVPPPAAACESLASPSEDTISHKKPRLRWGEGLAKFEKKKVDGVDDCETSNGPEQLYAPDENPTANASSDSATKVVFTSPAVGYSCSPGIEEKQFVKADVFDHDPTNLSSSSDIVSHQNNVEGSSFNLEILDQDSVACLDSAIDKLLLQSDCQSSGDSVFVRSTAKNKLLVWKGDMLKALEITESDIDKLEVELKSMTELEQVDLDGDSDVYQKPNSGVLNTNGEDVESPCSANSKLVENFFSEKDVSSKHDDDNYVRSSSKQEIVAADEGDKLHRSIWASNRDTANEAAEELNKLLPSKQSSFDIYNNNATGTTPLVEESSEIIKANLLRRKRFQRFNERVLALKFRVFQHLWNQDARLLSMKKNRVKSQKKLDHRLLALQNGKQKSRLSIYSRFSSSPGKLRFTPDVETIKFVGKLISESQGKPLRKALKMPSLTFDKKEIMGTRFVSINGLVEDPCADEKDRSVINLWTKEEIEIFLDNYSVYGKDFTKIASFITHKTTADCIEFYYKNHKSDFFKKATNKNPELAKQGKAYPTNNYLVASGKRLIYEANNDVASLDILGEVSAMAANAEDYLLETTTSTSLVDACENEKERENTLAAADVLAGICSSLSSEAIGSCITSVVVDPSSTEGGGYHERTNKNKRKRIRSSSWQRHLEPTCSDDYCGEEKFDPIDWSDKEKSIFLQSVSLYNGKDFAIISRCVGTRSRDQCKTFCSKARKCLALDDVISPESRSIFNDMSNVSYTCDDDEKPDLKLNSELESVDLSTLDTVCDSRNLINDEQMEKLDLSVDGEDKIDQNRKHVAINCKGTSEISSDIIMVQGHTNEKDGANLSDNNAKLKLYVNTEAVDILSSSHGGLPGNLQESDSSEKTCKEEATDISVDPSRPKGCSLGHNVEHQTLKGKNTSTLENGNCNDDTKPICSAAEQMRNNCSQSDSLGMEKSTQSGKVKLFGQILSKPSSPTIQQNGSTFPTKEFGS